MSLTQSQTFSVIAEKGEVIRLNFTIAFSGNESDTNTRERFTKFTVYFKTSKYILCTFYNLIYLY